MYISYIIMIISREQTKFLESHGVKKGTSRHVTEETGENNT